MPNTNPPKEIERIMKRDFDFIFNVAVKLNKTRMKKKIEKYPSPKIFWKKLKISK